MSTDHMEEDYRVKNARDGRAFYQPGKSVKQVKAELAASAAERATRRHCLAVSALELQDQADRLNELQGLVYRAQTVFEAFVTLDLPENVVGAMSEFGAIAMERAAEVYAEQAVVFATLQQRDLEELPEQSPEPATHRKGTKS